MFCIQLSFELLTIWKLSDAGNSAINCRLPPACNGCKPTSSSPFLLLLSSKRLASSDELSVPEQKCLFVNRNLIPKHSVTLQVYEKILNWLTHSLVIWWNCINHPTDTQQGSLIYRIFNKRPNHLIVLPLPCVPKIPSSDSALMDRSWCH
jgi:hypothetical protein